ncbi:MAG: polysaccharide deacetylase family protein [Pseudomonadota bacterium]
MSYFTHVVRSKGFGNVLPRALAIGRNFGFFSEERIEKKLRLLQAIMTRYSCPLTACVTACLAERYPASVEAMVQRGWEIAAHGKVHCDFRRLPLEAQTAELEEARRLYSDKGLAVTGFRAPYLAWNENTRTAAARTGFLWTSNQALLWPVFDRRDHSPRRWHSLELVLEHLYRPLRAERSVSIPQIREGVVEIPASLPDDEIPLDRLRISEGMLQALWLRLLKESRGRGELAVLLIHHERVPEFSSALKAVVRAARGRSGSLWLAGMGAIARWWQERSGFRLDIERVGGRYRVEARCSPSGVVLVKDGGHRDWPLPGWREIRARRFTLEASARPTIGLVGQPAPAAAAFLRNEGFVVEPRQGEHAVMLEGFEDFGPEAERALLGVVEAARGPLLRFWRWPRGVKSALALSMDVDSMTLLDFAKRSLQR